MSKTIVAASTPIGGAVAMVRMSGDLSKEIAEKLIGKKIKEFRKAIYATADTGVIKDKCEVIIYERGHSYTGEESAEIFCHGSEVIVREITDYCVKSGAVLAERGEFTLTAYRNNRIDLSEAEGILDLINAETVEQAVNAYDSVDGKLRKKIEGLQDKLKAIIAKVDVAIDYPEENIEDDAKEEAIDGLKAVNEELEELVSSYKDGCRIKNGIKVLILGKPNVGKSELFNALIGRKRAIVSDEEGTTRDFIESEYFFKGRKFVLVDTAGIRETENSIERTGIDMTLDEAKGADLIIGVGVKGDEFDVGRIKDLALTEEKILAVTNKSDIGEGENFNVSAKQNANTEKLKEEIYKRTDFVSHGLKINNLRQFQSLRAASEYIKSAMNCEMSLDCFASDLYNAYNKIGNVTGVIGSDEIIAEIFSAFCVGK